MTTRLVKLGVKQTIQMHWMDKTVQMLLAGLDEKSIRIELDDYLKTQKQSGGIGERGKGTYRMAISSLSAWFAPEKELKPFRDEALKLASIMPSNEWLPLHWAIISSAYPFWFAVAKQAGRLLNLQSQIVQSQVFGRLKELYGDREAVARNARYVVRSLVSWGVLNDTSTRGCYKRGITVPVLSPHLATILLESVLLASPGSKAALGMLLNNPGLFPFVLPTISGEMICIHSQRIEIIVNGFDDTILQLKAI